MLKFESPHGFQTFRVLSCEPDKIVEPSGEKQQHHTCKHKNHDESEIGYRVSVSMQCVEQQTILCSPQFQSIVTRTRQYGGTIR